MRVRESHRGEPEVIQGVQNTTESPCCPTSYTACPHASYMLWPHRAVQVFTVYLIRSTPEQTSNTTTTLEHSLSIAAWLSPSWFTYLTVLSLVICKITPFAVG